MTAWAGSRLIALVAAISLAEIRLRGTPFRRRVGRCHRDATSALERAPLHRAGKSGAQAAAGAPGVEPSAQTHHPDPQVVLAARLLDDSGDLAGVGLVAAWHDHAQVEPPPCPPDALDRALQVLLGDDAVGAGLVRAEACDRP